MTAKIYLFAILAILAACEAKKIKPIPANSHILKLVLKFNEDKIDDFVIDSFFATNNGESNLLLHCDVTLNDIIGAIPIKKLTVKDLAQAVNKLNLSITNDDLNDFLSNVSYDELKSMGFTTERVYKYFSKTYFKSRPELLQQCLDILGISTEFATAFTFGNDEDMFNVLKSANLSSANLAEIANIIGSTSTLKDLLNILGVKKFNQVLLSNFINTKVAPILFNGGLTEESLKTFVQSLGLSISNYKNSKSFKSCYSSLTKDISLAVAVSQNEIVTNDDSLISRYIILEPYTTLLAETVEASDTSYVISADSINANSTDNIIRIKVNGILLSYLQEASDYNNLQNQVCQYVTIDEDDDVIVQGITANLLEDQLTITKLYNSIFKKGSPLICGQNLYGLAAINGVNTVVFDYFEDKRQKDDEIENILEDPKVIKAIKEFFGKIVENFDPCKYLSCHKLEQDESPNEENKVTSGDQAQEENTDENITTSKDNEQEETEQVSNTESHTENKEEITEDTTNDATEEETGCNTSSKDNNEQTGISENVTESETDTSDNQNESGNQNEDATNTAEEEQNTQPEENNEDSSTTQNKDSSDPASVTQNEDVTGNPEIVNSESINTVENSTGETVVSESNTSTDKNEETKNAEEVSNTEESEVVTNGSTSL